jgi:hypothetical protein
VTKGKLLNKQTGLEIHGEIEPDTDGLSHFGFMIDGTIEYVLDFRSDEWDFIEDKPSAYEQYVALKPGTRFLVNQSGKPIDSVVRIKLDDDTYAYAYENAPGMWETNEAPQFQASVFSIEEA